MKRRFQFSRAGSAIGSTFTGSNARPVRTDYIQLVPLILTQAGYQKESS